MRRFALIFTVCSLFAPSVATADVSPRPTKLHLTGSHIGYPEDLYDFLFTEAVARTPSRNCGTLGISESKMRREFDKTIYVLLQKPVSIGRIRHFIRSNPQERIDADPDLFGRKHKLNEIVTEQDFCASGLGEINEGLRIGRLLKRN